MKPLESTIGARLNIAHGCMTGMSAKRGEPDCDTDDGPDHPTSSRSGEPVEYSAQSLTERTLLKELINLRQDVAALKRQQSVRLLQHFWILFTANEA